MPFCPDLYVAAEPPILSMNGLEAMAAIRSEFPDAKIIILTTFGNDVQGAMKLRARAYLLKAELDRELLGTISAVQAGK